ncbi:short-chain dehydrogenase [Salinigranum rubrum]|uniref:Short-chain dehydrogenase n=1 Tax=Salinigranum rubrum TaxID=755307 RepID=A0A2I8VFW3_9EURY|nr:SDR family oxidoreductase [Salinigranum rubrum]AUV80801.1 short-chain dehydrogenase [Salinigranum rubrum]
MDLQLTDKRAVVLASSQGIGLASAEALVAEGARVVISSRSESNLARAKDEILDATGADDDAVVTLTCDLSNPEEVAARIEEAIERLGGLDILVTNSGGPPKIGFDEATVEQFDEVYELVLRSVIVAVDAALPALKASEGVITNLIATSAQQPEANHVLANTVRPGIYGLSKSLAHEYADAGIRVNCVCPKKVGPVTETEKQRTTHIGRYAEDHGLDYEEARERFIADIIPLGRHGELAEFGKAVAFVSSPVAGYVTGHSLNVDGGWSKRLF